MQNTSWRLVANAQQQCMQCVQWEHQCQGGLDKDKLHRCLRAVEHWEKWKMWFFGRNFFYLTMFGAWGFIGAPVWFLNTTSGDFYFGAMFYDASMQFLNTTLGSLRFGAVFYDTLRGCVRSARCLMCHFFLCTDAFSCWAHWCGFGWYAHRAEKIRKALCPPTSSTNL